jgi:hypothetical protein
MWILFDFIFMHGLSFVIYNLLNIFNIENRFLDNIGFNMTRSLICGSISYYSYKNYNRIFDDKCLENETFSNELIHYHHQFLNYFIYDIFVMIYQVYKNINKNIRIDLLIHHLLAIFVLHIIDDHKMYNLSLIIGLSEGMSLLSGFKLLASKLGLKKYTNMFVSFRLFYLICIRLLFLWPSLILFYNDITNNCDKFKKNKNISLLLLFLGIIILNEMKWINSGFKELKRI